MSTKNEISISTLFAIIDSGVSYDQAREILSGDDEDMAASLIKRGKDYLKSQKLNDDETIALMQLDFDPLHLPSNLQDRAIAIRAAKAFAKMKKLKF